jgi:hypothetical protein
MMMIIIMVGMTIVIMGHEYERGSMGWRGSMGKGKGKEKDTEGGEDQNMLHVCV